MDEGQVEQKSPGHNVGENRERPNHFKIKRPKKGKEEKGRERRKGGERGKEEGRGRRQKGRENLRRGKGEGGKGKEGKGKEKVEGREGEGGRREGKTEGRREATGFT